MLQDMFVSNLNRILKTYTNFHIVIHDHQITIYDEMNTICQYDTLSSGEQAFINIICLLFSHDLQQGLLIIDEPETHLHPQSQKDFLRLIQETIRTHHLQVIIATHSPTLITKETIQCVFRCSKINNQTIIHRNNLS